MKLSMIPSVAVVPGGPADTTNASTVSLPAGVSVRRTHPVGIGRASGRIGEAQPVQPRDKVRRERQARAVEHLLHLLARHEAVDVGGRHRRGGRALDAVGVDAAFEVVKTFFFSSRYAERRLEPGICDFTFGNPHEMPIEGIVTAIRERAIPHDKNWFAYKTSEQDPRAFVAERLGRELDLTFEPGDIALTAGAFAAIMVAFRLVVDAGDEVIYSEPAWFCYEPMLLAANVVPRKVKLLTPTFDLDLAAIEAAIGPKTRLVIVNTPHNPTGRIYSRASLEALADLLERASTRIGHRIFLLSDEPYRKLRFDGRDFTSPAALYPWTLISYSYGKVLLAPGQRPRLSRYVALDANCGSTRSSECYVFRPDGTRLVFSQCRDAIRGAGP